MGKGLTAGLAVALIIVLAMFAAFVYFVQTYYGEGWDWGTGTGGGQTGSSGSTGRVGSSGKVGLGVIIEFADGRIKQVDPSQIQYTLFPLTVYVDGNPVKSLTWITYVYLDWEGDLTCLELKGPMKVEAGSVLVRKEGMWRKTGVNWNMPSKKTYVEVWRFTLQNTDIEAALGSGDFTLKCTSELTATATFSNGLTDTKSATATSNLQITVRAGALTAMLVDIQASSLR